MSSSRPGASPTNIRSALGLPTPYTTCVRVLERRHFSQTTARRWRSPSRSVWAPASAGGGRLKPASTLATSKCVYPKSRSSNSSWRRASSMTDFRDHQIENPVGHHDLRGPLDLRGRPVAADDQHFVLIGIEADGTVGDVVGHDQ